MTFMLRRWRLPLVALMAALGLTLATSSQAFAAQRGESATWFAEIENNVPVRAGSEFSEARDTAGNLVQVWRGYNTDNIYVSVNHGPPRTFPSAWTYRAPRIVSTNNGFRVFHTGTNGLIYYASLYTGGRELIFGDWTAVPHNAVTVNDQPPAVTALPNNGLYLAWRGSNSSETWGMYFNVMNGQWDFPVRIPLALSYSAPAIAFSASWNNRIVLVYRALDNRVAMVTQYYGSGTWSGAMVLGNEYTWTTPALALTANGEGQIGVIRASATSLTVDLTTIYAIGPQYSGWSAETTNAAFGYPPTLTTNGVNNTYLLDTNTQGYVYWKQSGSS